MACTIYWLPQNDVDAKYYEKLKYNDNRHATRSFALEYIRRRVFQFQLFAIKFILSIEMFESKQMRCGTIRVSEQRRVRFDLRISSKQQTTKVTLSFITITTHPHMQIDDVFSLSHSNLTDNKQLFCLFSLWYYRIIWLNQKWSTIIVEEPSIQSCFTYSRTADTHIFSRLLTLS